MIDEMEKFQNDCKDKNIIKRQLQRVLDDSRPFKIDSIFIKVLVELLVLWI